nr:histone H2B-like [Microcebus murinus]
MIENIYHELQENTTGCYLAFFLYIQNKILEEGELACDVDQPSDYKWVPNSHSAIFGSPEPLTAVSPMAEPSSEMSSEACSVAKEPEEAESSTTEAQKQPKHRGRRPAGGSDSFSTYFPRVLKNIHDGLSLSQESRNMMDSFVQDIFERIALEAGRLARYTHRSTVTSREIQTAVRLVLPGKIGKHAVSEGNKAIVRYTHHK